MLRRPCTRIELKQTDLDEYDEAKAKAKAQARKLAKAKGEKSPAKAVSKPLTAKQRIGLE